MKRTPASFLSVPLAALTPEALYRTCDPAALSFSTTAELEPMDRPAGQERAIAALEFGLAMRSDGYNLFALGPQGTGKGNLVKRLLARIADTRPAPPDWCYIYNFDDPQRPKALPLPSGRALPLKKDMETLVVELRAAIPAAYESEDYRNRHRMLEGQDKARHEQEFGDLQRRAAEKNVALIRTPVGLALAPTRDGEVIPPEDFAKLPEEERERYKNALMESQEQLETLLRQVPIWEKEQREQLRALNREVLLLPVDHLIGDLRGSYEDIPAVGEYLDAVREDVLDHVEDFMPSPQDTDNSLPAIAPALPRRAGPGSPFRRYAVNVVVGHQGGIGAPVIVEGHPTQPNLIGRIEHMAQFGALIADFTLIRAGALHRANGGFLVLDAHKLLMQPFAYEDLKRALRGKEIRIEPPGSAWGMTAATLEPEPIPLDVKIVLVGEPMLYYLLSHHDPEFAELFKVAADFDYRMPRDPAGVMGYARTVADMCAREGLRPLTRQAVARMVEHGARLAGDADKLSTHMSSLADLVREANHWADQDRTETIERDHVQKALDSHMYRSDRVREHIQEDIRNGTLLIDTEGEMVGQINGLAVLQLGRFSFGKPNRITCRVRAGRGEVVDIEREVQLGGPLHTKGVLILSAFLAARYAATAPLSLSASLVFEQSYGGVDGDSASSAELYALLSALAEAPIHQGFAVTGSVNQLGQVQAIGGVNEKIEGFFDICRNRGLDGSHGVLIPASNVRHLMLHSDVVDAVRAGQFAIYPIETIDQGIERLTGIPAGERAADGKYPSGSINRKVAMRLASLAKHGRRDARFPHPARRSSDEDSKDL